MQDFEFVREADKQHAVRPDLNVTVEGGRVFHRRAIKFGCGDGVEKSRSSLLVAELNGVFVYFRDGHLLMTSNGNVKA